MRNNAQIYLNNNLGNNHLNFGQDFFFISNKKIK